MLYYGVLSDAGFYQIPMLASIHLRMPIPITMRAWSRLDDEPFEGGLLG